MLYKGIYLVVNNLATYLYYYLSKTGKHRLILRQKWCTLCNTSMKGNTYSQKKLLDNHSYKFKSTSLLSSISNLNSNHCTKWICWMTIREGTRRDHFARGGEYDFSEQNWCEYYSRAGTNHACAVFNYLFIYSFFLRFLLILFLCLLRNLVQVLIKSSSWIWAAILMAS